MVETPVPRRLGNADVEHVRAATRAVASAENLFGGGVSCEASMAQLRWAGRLLDVPASRPVRQDMAEAVGNMAGVAAFAAFDIAEHTVADRCFAFALWCADEAGSWDLRANTLAEMARKATYRGRFDEALELIEYAQVRSDRVTATARVMLATLRARLLALTGRHAHACAEIDRADAEFVDRNAELDPPWLCYYDAAEHQGSTGKALIPIARSGDDPEAAAGRLAKAVELQAAAYPRSRAFSQARLASLLIETGHPRQAVEVGHEAVLAAAAVRSTRLTTELHGLAQAASAYAQVGDVVDLRREIARLG
ncbi:XRE family transcriptional regulator [Prauserella halophila]|uniref:XRE family transcriptional regulator n=1 Tax=Prauserella halophila TaxID=185641 RepID=UPI0031D4E337